MSFFTMLFGDFFCAAFKHQTFDIGYTYHSFNWCKNNL